MRKEVLIAALVVLSALPIVTAQIGPNSHDAARSAGDARTSALATTALRSESTTGSSTVAASSSSTGEATETWNYTKLHIESENGYLELKPGETETITVTVQNGEDRAVTVSPHLYEQPVGRNQIQNSWLAISGDTSIDAGEESEFTITVSVPKNAEIDRYSGMIAFTDEVITYPGQPPRPVHAVHVGVRVWKEPTVKILSNTYVHRQVEAGESVTSEIVIKNTGDSAVPLSPELARERGHCRGSGCPIQLEPSWIDIDAPNEIGAGETATVTVTMAPSADADRGRYDTEIDLGLKDPARPDDDNYWQQIRLNYIVWKQPADPFETTVDVSKQTRALTLTLTPRSAQYPESTADESASFDVQFVSPNGETIDAQRTSVTNRGFVDLSGRQRQLTDGDYAVRNGGTEFVYRVNEPMAGEWSVRIVPHNTIGFNYELVHDESKQ